MFANIKPALVLIVAGIAAATLVVAIPQANAVFLTPGTTQSGQTNEGEPGCSPSQSNDAPSPCGGAVPDPPGANAPPNPPSQNTCFGRSSGNCNPPD